MENTIVQLSKYVITFLMICFTVQSFAALKERVRMSAITF